VQASIQFPPGYYAMWSGQYEYLGSANARLKIVIPMTLLIIFLLLYLNFRSVTETMIVMLSLPFAMVGGLWLMRWLGFNLSVAVAVGFIALAGAAAETGVVMLIYLNQALDEVKARRKVEGRALTRGDLYDAIMEDGEIPLGIAAQTPGSIKQACRGSSEGRTRWDTLGHWDTSRPCPRTIPNHLSALARMLGLLGQCTSGWDKIRSWVNATSPPHCALLGGRRGPDGGRPAHIRRSLNPTGPGC
jgi:AcrB/AcrD/AcrF family